ncbi:MAG: type II secretion system F family protein [Pseudomonadota bacterium]
MAELNFYQVTPVPDDGAEPPAPTAPDAPAAPVSEGFSLNEFLDRVWISMVDSYGPAGPFYLIALIGILIAILALPVVMRKRKDPLDRFSFREARQDNDLITLRTDNDDGRLKTIGDYLQPQDDSELSETRKTLRSAGYKDASAVRVYYFTRAALSVGLLAISILIFLVRPAEPDIPIALALSAAFALVGYLIPTYWVRRQIESRRQEIENAFPDAMDMMLVCMEGGQSLDQAMSRVGIEMRSSATPLSEELQIVTDEFRAGKERVSVLRDFASRCSVTDISSFVTVLIQSQAFGTSVSQALRVYAAEMRDKRLMRAEEKANVLPTKLTLGTMAFTVPPLILILVGPSFIQILRALSGFP